MFFRVILGSLLAAVMSFMLGFVWWMITPFPQQVIHELPESHALALGNDLPETGAYFYPWKAAGAGEDRFKIQEELEPKRAKGPIIQMMFNKRGIVGGPEFYLVGLGHGLVAALLAAGILALVAPSLPTYPSRVGFVFLLGLFASVTLHGSDLIWMHQPWQWVAFSAAFTIVNWLLAGIILGAFVKARIEPKPVIV